MHTSGGEQPALAAAVILPRPREAHYPSLHLAQKQQTKLISQFARGHGGWRPARLRAACWPSLQHWQVLVSPQALASLQMCPCFVLLSPLGSSPAGPRPDFNPLTLLSTFTPPVQLLPRASGTCSLAGRGGRLRGWRWWVCERATSAMGRRAFIA